jgi:molecular chaperone IbpA
MAMATVFDFSPLFRSSIGFDRVFDLLENANKVQAARNWPPYDVVRTGDDNYRIVIAVPGFTETDLDLSFQPNLLVISGTKVEQSDGDYLYRGITSKTFEHRFQLAEHVKVNSAKLSNGLLSVELAREVPEAMKPRRITINQQDAIAHTRPAQIESQQAA